MKEFFSPKPTHQNGPQRMGAHSTTTFPKLGHWFPGLSNHHPTSDMIETKCNPFLSNFSWFFGVIRRVNAQLKIANDPITSCRLWEKNGQVTPNKIWCNSWQMDYNVYKFKIQVETTNWILECFYTFHIFYFGRKLFLWYVNWR